MADTPEQVMAKARHPLWNEVPPTLKALLLEKERMRLAALREEGYEVTKAVPTTTCAECGATIRTYLPAPSPGKVLVELTREQAEELLLIAGEWVGMFGTVPTSEEHRDLLGALRAALEQEDTDES